MYRRELFDDEFMAGSENSLCAELMVGQVDNVAHRASSGAALAHNDVVG